MEEELALKAVRWREKEIMIHRCQREEYQTIYRDSLQGKITCLHCGQPVRLHLGIATEPFFIHPPTDLECLKMSEAYIENTQKKDENNEEKQDSFFQLPKRRSIQQEGEVVSNWKAPRQVSAISPFSVPTLRTPRVRSDFSQTLEAIHYTLDENQWEAVQTTAGPLLLLAGAGSGKTRVLTARTAYMLTEKQIPANRLLLVTFTAKAAKEMKERMRLFPSLTNQQLQQLVVGTFHSIFYKILAHHNPQKWQQDRLLKSEGKKDALLKQIGRELEYDEKEFPYDQALAQIGWWKNNLLLPNAVAPKVPFEEKVLSLYQRYEEIKNREGLFDFDDMLIGCFQLLTEQEQLLKKYQERFAFMCIDEFQDINKAQYEIVRLLSAKYENLCVVGDDDQSIYSFRGSNPDYILHFKRNFPEAATIVLNKNYRSTHPIVETANQVISKNKNRYSKSLIAMKDSALFPLTFFPYDEEEEATMIVSDIQEQLEQGVQPKDIAVLYRTNVMARALFERLVQSNLPFTMELEGEGFYRRKTIRKVLAYLRLSENQDDEQAMTDLIGALFLKQGVLDELLSYRFLYDCTLVDALTKVKSLPSFQEEKLQKIVSNFAKLKQLSPLAAITFIEQEMGLNDYIRKNGSEGNKMERGSDDMNDLKVIAKHFATIPAFLEHVNQMNTAYKSQRKHFQSHAEPAIQLMTIHRSKGLEFNHLYLLGAVEGGLPHDYALESAREGDNGPLEEERRLMYVAITRAKECLKISVPSMRRGKRASRSRFLDCF